MISTNIFNCVNEKNRLMNSARLNQFCKNMYNKFQSVSIAHVNEFNNANVMDIYHQ